MPGRAEGIPGKVGLMEDPGERRQGLREIVLSIYK